MSHRKTDLGILYPSKSAKVVLTKIRAVARSRRSLTNLLCL
jgi:hypothetical protein